MAGSSNIIGFRVARTIPASGAAPVAAVPGRNTLSVPNPARPGVRIAIRLAAPARVRVEIYRVNGELVRNLPVVELPQGVHHIAWDGCTAAGTNSACGTYYVRAGVGSEVLTQKTVLLR
jgi:hypothetical protein